MEISAVVSESVLEEISLIEEVEVDAWKEEISVDEEDISVDGVDIKSSVEGV